jgi:hypothetical protein
LTITNYLPPRISDSNGLNVGSGTGIFKTITLEILICSYSVKIKGHEYSMLSMLKGWKKLYQKVKNDNPWILWLQNFLFYYFLIKETIFKIYFVTKSNSSLGHYVSCTMYHLVKEKWDMLSFTSFNYKIIDVQSNKFKDGSIKCKKWKFLWKASFLNPFVLSHFLQRPNIFRNKALFIKIMCIK